MGQEDTKASLRRHTAQAHVETDRQEEGRRFGKTDGRTDASVKVVWGQGFDAGEGDKVSPLVLDQGQGIRVTRASMSTHRGSAATR